LGIKGRSQKAKKEERREKSKWSPEHGVPPEVFDRAIEKEDAETLPSQDGPIIRAGRKLISKKKRAPAVAGALRLEVKLEREQD
jgi:hypothetical protein